MNHRARRARPSCWDFASCTVARRRTVGECRDTMGGAVEEDCGIASNIAKQRLTSQPHPRPAGPELGPAIWLGENPVADPFVGLGRPLGHSGISAPPGLPRCFVALAMCTSPPVSLGLCTKPPRAKVAQFGKLHVDAFWDAVTWSWAGCGCKRQRARALSGSI